MYYSVDCPTIPVSGISRALLWALTQNWYPTMENLTKTKVSHVKLPWCNRWLCEAALGVITYSTHLVT